VRVSTDDGFVTDGDEQFSSSDDATPLQSEDEDDDGDDDGVFLSSKLDDLVFLTGPSRSTLGEALLKICKLYSDHYCSKTLLDHFLKVIFDILPENSNFPKSLYMLYQIIDEYTPSPKNQSVQYYCGSCHLKYGNEDRTECDRCSATRSAVFVSNDLQILVKNFMESKGLAKQIENYESIAAKVVDGKFGDIVHGRKYKSLKKDKYDLALIQNLDGFPVTNSGKAQVWPNFLAICDIEPKLRSNFILLQSIWYSPSKPDMIDLLNCFVDSFEPLSTQGVDWQHPATGKSENSKLFVIASTVDAQARYAMQNISPYNGKYGCSFCEIPGTKCIHEKGSSSKIYPFRDSSHPLRTMKKMLKQAEFAINNEPSSEDENCIDDSDSPFYFATKGVKGYTPMALLKQFNVANGFSPDYLHSCLLGVVRRNIFSIIEGSNAGKDFQVSRYIGLLNIKLSNIKPPSFIRRLPRGLDEVRNWKGSELRNWLLYYSLICLRDIWPTIYLEHHLLLVYSIHTLLKDDISKDEIETVRVALNEYCKTYPRLYSLKDSTFNLHMLTHYPDSVLQFGPLQMHSTFMFESANFKLGQSIHGSGVKIAVELQNTMRIINFFSFLKYKFQSNKTSLRNIGVDLLGAKLKAEKVDTNISDYLQQRLVTLEDVSIEYYLRARVKGVLYNSKLYNRAKRTDSSILKFSNAHGGDEYVAIMYFLKASNSKNYVVGKKIEILAAPTFENHSVNISVKHILPFRVSNEITIFNATKIKSPVIVVENFLCTPPNLFECNL
jgi:hypothetical protein